MKRFCLSCVIAVFALALVGANQAAYAQKKKKSSSSKNDSKAEAKKKADDEKKLKAELKKLTVDAYRGLKEGKAKAEKDAAELRSENARLKELEAQCAQEEENLKRQIEELLGKVRDAEAAPKGGQGFNIPNQGTYYVVQIGAFQQKDVETNPNNPDFRKESSDGFHKYIMGVFNDINQADQLRAFLLQLDFRRNPAYRPFIAPYKDGRRITLEEAVGPEEAQRRKAQMGLKK